MNKYQKLAKIMLKRDWHTWYAVKDYISKFRTYDNWTLRDIDKVVKLIK